MGLSIRAYARRRRVSHVAVLRAIKQGRVPIEPDGTIDPAKADASWQRSTDDGRAKSTPKGSAEKLRPIGKAALGSVPETLKEQGLPSGGSVTFVQARTAHEIAKARLTRLDDAFARQVLKKLGWPIRHLHFFAASLLSAPRERLSTELPCGVGLGGVAASRRTWKRRA